MAEMTDASTPPLAQGAQNIQPALGAAGGNPFDAAPNVGDAFMGLDLAGAATGMGGAAGGAAIG